MSDNPASTDGTTPDGTPTPVVAAGPMDPQPKVYDEVYVKSLRDEAASARVAKKTAVEEAVAKAAADHAVELAERDTAYTELQNELGQAWVLLQKYETAIDLKVDSDKVRAFVEILKGEDEASITESAQSGLQLFGGLSKQIPGFDPSQGRGGKPPIPLNGDPILDSMKAVLGIK